MRGVAHDPVLRAKLMALHERGVPLAVLSEQHETARPVLSRWWAVPGRRSCRFAATKPSSAAFSNATAGDSALRDCGGPRLRLGRPTDRQRTGAQTRNRPAHAPRCAIAGDRKRASCKPRGSPNCSYRPQWQGVGAETRQQQRPDSGIAPPESATHHCDVTTCGVGQDHVVEVSAGFVSHSPCSLNLS
jgi:hypothetical protein